MAEGKKKRDRLTSPRGIAVYPRVDGKPDTKFNKDGVWQLQLAVEGDDAEAFKAVIDKAMKESLKWAKENKEIKPGKKFEMADPPYQPEYEKDKDGKNTDEETGRTLFRFKLNAKGERRDGTEYSQHVTVLKSNLEPFVDSRLGGGSEVKVGYELAPFSMPVTQGKDKGDIMCGVSLKLRVVQVLKYVPYEGGSDPKSFGMAAEEGFEGDDEPTTTTEDEEEDTPTPAPKKGKKVAEPEPEEEEEDEPAPKPKKGKPAPKKEEDEDEDDF